MIHFDSQEGTSLTYVLTLITNVQSHSYISFNHRHVATNSVEKSGSIIEQTRVDAKMEP